MEKQYDRAIWILKILDVKVLWTNMENDVKVKIYLSTMSRLSYNGCKILTLLSMSKLQINTAKRETKASEFFTRNNTIRLLQEVILE